MVKVEYQHTLAREVALSGVGLHTGCKATVTIAPAPANAGFSFVLADGSRIAATPETVRSTVRCTTLGSATAEVNTVEHVLAALLGMDVDNAQILIDGEEIPIMDGSALPFARAIADAGLQEQRVPRRVLTLSSPFWHRDGDKLLVCIPADRFKINFFVAFPEPVGNQFSRNGSADARVFLAGDRTQSHVWFSG